MSRYGQRWQAFRAWYDSVEPAERVGGSKGVRSALLVRIEDLTRHVSGTGARCPRCGGQVLRWHRSADACCLQCGFEPIQKPPSVYVFEPYDDAAATSKAAFLPEKDHRNGPVTVRRIEPLTRADQCVECGALPERLRVNRCPDCYGAYVARLRMGVA